MKHILCVVLSALLVFNSSGAASVAYASDSQSQYYSSTNQDAGAPADAGSQDTKAASVWDGSRIHLGNYAQLALVGTGTAVTSADLEASAIGTGSTLFGSDGSPITYSLDAAYYLDDDIELPAQGTWQLPSGFSGSFTGPADADGSRLWDAASDTIFIQNPYQLAVLASEDREDAPVVTGDANPRTFGMGQLVFEEDGQTALTYSARHTYVLSAAFSAQAQVPTMLTLGASPSRDAARKSGDNGENGESGQRKGGTRSGASSLVDGRDFFGQAAVTIDGVNYILIGDRQQLDAINDSGTVRAKVSGAVYKVVQTRASLVRGWDDPDNITSEVAELVYPGDADLVAGVTVSEGATQDFSDKMLWAKADVGHLLPGHNYDYHDLDEDGALTQTRTVYCAVDPATGAYDLNKHSSLGGDNYISGLTYTKSATQSYTVAYSHPWTNTGPGSFAVHDSSWRQWAFDGQYHRSAAQNRGRFSFPVPFGCGVFY